VRVLGPQASPGQILLVPDPDPEITTLPKSAIVNKAPKALLNGAINKQIKTLDPPNN